ncbi:hypothetical protein DK847_03040 [Aestuariivirga litoralis]|uniref:O-antigen ligase-related domain-containing protein n=1 Tax=Aestuariivirga litoralis TaxID=2650924 RepID=A0A2W2BSY3_9HYPH|nr:O-antigen ligase family protein [Aestuariivirga litoralis]PZF78787.1 hypothetical protein DK847_03040 [Aestuariivirga litoralis]
MRNRLDMPVQHQRLMPADRRMAPPPRARPAPPQPRSRRAPALLWAYLPLLLALALRLASEETADISYLVLAVYALTGRAQAIRALAMLWLLSMLNPELAPTASAAGIGRYAVLLGAGASAMLRSRLLRAPARPFTMATMLLGVFIAIHALLFSAIPDVSILKAVSWTLAMASLISHWCGLSPAQRQGIAGELFLLLVAVLAASLPLIASPAIGFKVNGTGFQGILNHPQVFGSAMGLLAAWATARLLGLSRPPYWLLGVAGLALLAVLMSEARTAGLAMAASMVLGILFGPRLARRPLFKMLPGLRSGRLWTMFSAVLLASIVAAPLIADRFQTYITKSNRVEVTGIVEAFNNSRGGLMASMLENIYEHPWFGIGFGIGSEPEIMVIERDSVFGLPTSAVVEKGVTPIAVVEEMGVFGALLFGIWLLQLLRSAARGGFEPLTVSLTIVMLNFGEATLFSPGGTGLLSLILLGWAFSSGVTRTEGRRG